jgi:hypothetical protein
MYEPGEMAQWTDPVNPFDIAKPFAPGTPSYFALVAPLMHAMVIDVLPEAQAAWSVLVEQPPGSVRDRMLAEFDAMPRELRLRWPDEELRRHGSEILDNNSHPRHEQLVTVLAEIAKKVTDRWQKDPDQRYQDQLRWTIFYRQQYRKVLALAARGQGE